MYKNINKGFTLIELLIVIAIIGVLAATVVVSLGDQTGNAREGSVKIGVAGIASLARIEVDTARTAFTGNDLCNEVYKNVAGEDKGTWGWNGGNICAWDEADVSGEMCCSSAGNQWVIWGNIEGSGGAGTSVYCADSLTKYRGLVTLSGSSTTSKALEDTDGTATPVERCEKP